MYSPPGIFDKEEQGVVVEEGEWRREIGNVTSFLPIAKTGRKSSILTQAIGE